MISDELARRLVTAARKGREWQARRDELIVQALEEGATQAEVAQLAGMSQPGVHALWHRARGD